MVTQVSRENKERGSGIRDSPVVGDEDLAETKLAEHVDDSLHGRVIRHRDRGKIEDASQLEGRRSVPGRRDVRREQD